VVREPTFELGRRALYLFIAAIALGCVNLLFHVRRVRHRTSLIVMHALTAVSGVGTLIYAFVQYAPVPPAAPAAPRPAAATPAPAVANAMPSGATPAQGAANVAALKRPAATQPAPGATPDAPPSSAAVAPKSSVEPVIDPALRQALVHPILFDRESSSLAGVSSAVLDQVAAALKAHGEVTEVEVQGHADERGDDERNLTLTRKRAEAVVDSLVARGVNRRRMRVAGYGARCPSDPACGRSGAPESCHGRESWDKDRRVVVVPLRAAGVALQGPIVCERAADLIPPEDRAYQAGR
jgi:outer membrane protein OmpA-like peptidoglycan-associated protein